MLAASAKGRSSTKLKRVFRRRCALELAGDVILYFVLVPSNEMPAAEDEDMKEMMKSMMAMMQSVKKDVSSVKSEVHGVNEGMVKLSTKVDEVAVVATNTKNFLQGIGIPTESVAQMVPVVHHESKLGSGCEVYFVHSAEFEYAKSKARYMRKVQPPCTQPIFVAEKQTEEQRALKRTMQRLAECLRDAESEKPADQQHKVELKYRTKVYYKDKLAAYISKNASADQCPIEFSPFGLQEFPETSRKLAVGYALA